MKSVIMKQTKKYHEIRRKMVPKHNNVTSFFFLLHLLNINESFGVQFKCHPHEDGKQNLKHIFPHFISEDDFRIEFRTENNFYQYFINQFKLFFFLLKSSFVSFQDITLTSNIYSRNHWSMEWTSKVQTLIQSRLNVK